MHEFAGKTYRLITRGIRMNRGAGNEDLVVERPVARSAKGDIKRDRKGSALFLDSDEAPTLVTFDELVSERDVRFQLKIGAIEPLPQPLPVDGEGSDPQPRAAAIPARTKKPPADARAELEET